MSIESRAFYCSFFSFFDFKLKLLVSSNYPTCFYPKFKSAVLL